MDIRESLSKIAKSVSDGAINAAKKSGDIVETTKLNMTISTQEDKLNDIYSGIGEKIYKKYLDGSFSDNDFKDYFNKVSYIKDYIDYLNKKINDINNIVVCQKCGAELNSDTAFCPKCGNKLSVDKANDNTVCISYNVSPKDISSDNSNDQK